MNILVIGSGGREHALAWKLAQSPRAERIFCAPGNPGTASVSKAENVALDVKDFEAIAQFCAQQDIQLVAVGPEDPLCAGIADALKAHGLRVFGPAKAAARIEGSKEFAKDFMQRCSIPTAAYASFTEVGAAEDYIRKQGAPIVVKADGLAAGKGVTVALDVDAAIGAVHEAMLDKAFGDAGGTVVIEEFMAGEEASILAFCDGTTFRVMASSQDHKAVFDGDKGPNTGGMGAYSPAPVVTPELQERIDREILAPFVQGMRDAGSPYVGIIYAGLMITETGPRVVEFNCRFGDPETQVVLPRLQGDLVEIMEACIDGTLDQVELAFDAGACVAVVMASEGYPGGYPKGRAITGIEAAEANDGIAVFHAGTALTDGQLVTSGGRVLAVTASGGALPDTIRRAYEAVAEVHFEGAHYRTDIGQKALKRL
ncbi:MAG: phosphoribosylamine--glycine ligase [Candidatus Hydrogenedens sp.]|nr:phosphoribosylamine--glycine ligase [Candidatus Hydrogenedens sp.]